MSEVVKVKHLVGVGGVVLTIVGWGIGNVERVPGLYRVVAPRYLRATSALRRMHEKGFVLRQGDVGFREISEVLKKDIVGGRVPVITEVKTLGWGMGAANEAEGMRFRNYIELEVSFANSRAATGKFYDLKSGIEGRWLNRNVFRWGDAVFWVGVVVSVIGVFLK